MRATRRFIHDLRRTSRKGSRIGMGQDCFSCADSGKVSASERASCNLIGVPIVESRSRIIRRAHLPA